ncbi:hypothetical protein FQN57_001948 [Myotisia sp. PD_48]|nr:hypothetical protein FQN57_001948 [Myotisia sp. PD_48]
MASNQLAFIGLGNMGRGSLAHPLIIYNRTQSRATEFAKTMTQPVILVPTVQEAVNRSNMIFMCLGDDIAVESTIQAALETDVTGKLFVDCSTIHPDTTRRQVLLLESRGASFVACPVFGAPPVADAGQLVCVLAGRKQAVEQAKPYFAGVMGRANIDLSQKNEDPGAASTLKVLGNTLVVQMVTAVSESMVVAEKTGLGVDVFHDLLEHIFPGFYVSYSNRMKSGEYYQREEPLFAVDLARKDARHAMDIAKGVGARMKGVERADEYLQAVKAHSGEKGDIAGIYGVARQEAGMKFENQ